MAMSRKNYEAVAARFSHRLMDVSKLPAEVRPTARNEVVELARALAVVFSDDPRFDTRGFLVACGVS